MKKRMRTGFAFLTALVLCLTLLCSCAKSNDAAEDLKLPTETMSAEQASGSANPSLMNKDEIGSSLQDGGEAYETKIIRTAKLYAETKEFDRAMGQIEENVASLGGYVESSDVSEGNYNTRNGQGTHRATLSLRIPADRLDEFLSMTGTLVNVTSSSTTASDISGEYYDIEARLSVLETERQVLEKMLSQSSSVSNMITVEERLYEVIYEIESYRTMLKVYDKKVAYSTVTMELCEVLDLTVVPAGNGFGERFKKAVSESWDSFVEFWKDAAIWFVYAFPTLIVLALLGGACVTLILWGKKRRRAKKQAKAEGNGKTE